MRAFGILMSFVLLFVFAVFIASDMTQGYAVNRSTLVFLIMVAGTIFFLPAYIAFLRGSPFRWIILILNGVIGVTGIGWLGCFIWSIFPRRREQRSFYPSERERLS